MGQIGNVEEIKRIKACLDTLKKNGLIIEWELPYENLLTRYTAAIFFFTPAENFNPADIRQYLTEFPDANVLPHEPANISRMPYKIVFDQKANN